jgi:hypothetical protein
MELNGTVRSLPIDVVLMNNPALFSLKCGIKVFVVRIAPSPSVGNHLVLAANYHQAVSMVGLNAILAGVVLPLVSLGCG